MISSAYNSSCRTNEDGSVVLINIFTIDLKDEEALLAACSHDASFMKEKTRLYIHPNEQSYRG